MNRVVLIGRLTKDPELRTSKSGKNKATFTLAVNRRTTNEDGEHQADFISCVAWNSTADTIAKYFKKGKEVAIEGRIQTGSYDAFDGTKRYTTDVVVDNLTFIGNKNTNDKQEESSKNVNELFEEEIELSDADLPF